MGVILKEGICLFDFIPLISEQNVYISQMCNLETFSLGTINELLKGLLPCIILKYLFTT